MNPNAKLKQELDRITKAKCIGKRDEQVVYDLTLLTNSKFNAGATESLTGFVMLKATPTGIVDSIALFVICYVIYKVIILLILALFRTG